MSEQKPFLVNLLNFFQSEDFQQQYKNFTDELKTVVDETPEAVDRANKIFEKGSVSKIKT